ncbi:hypothetical protein HHK36_014325 [Tetracentron sinense]|uniref:Epidermal patterning factor-like protein n=1 Tax=Tetracentron sinense TaxID=13715 RepID=A0A834Z7V4_TETSI|nr:hypothetical protein HHK36_014325 [Tetracentron sinense]
MWVSERMKRNIFCFVIAVLQIARLVSAASRPFAPYDPAHQHGQSPQSLQASLGTNQGFNSMEGVAEENEEAYTGLNRLGSRPPNCEHKCGGCSPCEAIQVPTTSDRLGIQYANYEPEGWKCKCGPSFFNP